MAQTLDCHVVDRVDFPSCRGGQKLAGCGVVCGDGEFGAAEHGPFDRIIVTVGARDIPPAWVEQLAEGGRLLVPLRTKGLNRSWALERCGGYLVACDPMTCGFVPMQGLGEHRGQSIPLHGDEVSLWLDAGQQVDTASLGEVLSTPRAQAWSGVTVRKRETFDDLDLWLARLPGFCILSSTRDAVDRGLVSPDWHLVGLALVDRGSSLAYLAKPRPVGADKTARELGAYAHGPDAAEVADRFGVTWRACLSAPTALARSPCSFHPRATSTQRWPMRAGSASSGMLRTLLDVLQAQLG